MNDFLRNVITHLLQAKAKRTGPWHDEEEKRLAFQQAAALEQLAAVEKAKGDLLTDVRAKNQDVPALRHRQKQLDDQHQKLANDEQHHQEMLVRSSIAQERLNDERSQLTALHNITLATATSKAMLEQKIQTHQDALAHRKGWHRWLRTRAVKDHEAAVHRNHALLDDLDRTLQDQATAMEKALKNVQTATQLLLDAQRQAQTAEHAVTIGRAAVQTQRSLLFLAQHQEAQEQWDRLPSDEKQAIIATKHAENAARQAAANVLMTQRSALTLAVPEESPALQTASVRPSPSLHHP